MKSDTTTRFEKIEKEMKDRNILECDRVPLMAMIEAYGLVCGNEAMKKSQDYFNIAMEQISALGGSKYPKPITLDKEV